MMDFTNKTRKELEDIQNNILLQSAVDGVTDVDTLLYQEISEELKNRGDKS